MQCSGIRVQGLEFLPSPFICKGEGRVRVSGRFEKHQTHWRRSGFRMPDTSLQARLHPHPSGDLLVQIARRPLPACACGLGYRSRSTGWKSVPRSHLNHLEGRAVVLLFSVAQLPAGDFFFLKVSAKRMTGWKAFSDSLEGCPCPPLRRRNVETPGACGLGYRRRGRGRFRSFSTVPISGEVARRNAVRPETARVRDFNTRCYFRAPGVRILMSGAAQEARGNRR